MSDLFKDIIDSIKGNEQDFTRMKLRRSVILLAVPMVLEMIMESLFALADIVFVSKLGAEATATVGITESLMTIIYAIGMGLSMATTGIVARRIGENRPRTAAKSATQAIILGVFLSIPFLIVGIFYGKEILSLMGASNNVQAVGTTYSSLMIGSNLIIMLLFINNAIFRSAGDAMISMLVMMLSNLLNILLDPCLIFGLGPFPELGVTGAAVATVTGRGIGVLLQFYMFFFRKRRIHLNKSALVFDLKIILRLFKLSLGGIAQFLIATTSWVGLYRLMTEFGDNVVAGYTIAIRIIIFSLLPAWGLSNAASTLVGQNLGALKPERAERVVWAISLVNIVFLVSVGFCFYFLSAIIVGTISSDIYVQRAGILCLKILCFGYGFYALGMVMSQAFNGAGDTITPTIINLICFWFIEIPLAYFLSVNSEMREKGIFVSIVVAESILGIMAMFLFRRGKWKLREV